MSEPATSKLGKYEVLGILGRGGMGVVYKGFDPHLERTVAIKTIRRGLYEEDQEAEILQRFKREAQAVARLSHPNIVAVYDYAEDAERPFIAMEFVQGRELGDILAEGESFDLERIVRILEQVLSALAYCHANGVVHRDLKPANILLLDDGTVKVMDFGIARVDASTLTRTGAVMGTPTYMSPEQLTGQQVDARSDLFSAAVILYELVTGEKPFPGKTFPAIMQRVLMAKFEAPSRLNVHLSDSWDRLLARALAKRPDLRFQSAAEFVEGLRLAAEDRYHDSLPGKDEEETMVAGLDTAPTVLRPAAARRAAAAAAPRPPTPPPRSSGPAAGRAVHDETERLPHAALAGGGTVPSTPASGMARRGRRVLLGGIALVLLASAAGGAGWWFLGRAAGVEGGSTADVGAPRAGAASLRVSTSPLDGSYYGLVAAVSEPAGAVFYIDDVEFGETPLELEFPPGTYRVRLLKSGYRPVETRLDVEQATRLDLDAVLVPE